MDFSKPEFSYVFLIIPVLFCLAMVAQGIVQLVHHKKSGIGVIAIGLVFLGVVFWMFENFIK